MGLYPHVGFRGISMQVNFGPNLEKTLPFKCRTLQEAAQVDLSPVACGVPKGCKPEVVFPVAFPDEGGFDWVDEFISKHPHYAELSDRKIIAWANKSGLHMTKKSVDSK